jgi:hypothetical protein
MAAVLFSELPSENSWPPRRRIRGGFLLASQILRGRKCRLRHIKAAAA